jgi:hypothetical protein
VKELLWGAGFGAGFFGLCLIVGSGIFNSPDLTLSEEDY